MTNITRLFGTTALVAILASPAFAADQTDASKSDKAAKGKQAEASASETTGKNKKAAKQSGTPADQRNVAKASDGEWLSLSGEVQQVSGETFTLDHGDDEIIVEMDDYDWFDENVVKKGDRVTVTGRMDKDFIHDRKIEASSVYIKPLSAYYFANAADEEDGYYSAVIDLPNDDEWVSFAGEVTKIDGENIVLDTGLIEYDVDAGNLGYDPFDREGLGQIDVGERVVITGRMDDADLFDEREIEATSITTLSGMGAAG